MAKHLVPLTPRRPAAASRSSSRSTGRALAVWCKSLGCPKNRVDTETLLGHLGVPVREAASIGRADLVFVNTCGFIDPAVRESIATILEAAGAAHRARRRPLVAVGGCLVGRYGVEELAKGLPEVDLWLPTSELASWPDMIRRHLGLERACDGVRLLSTGPSFAWLKVAEGCRHRCAFCTIPSIRGPLRSLPKASILDEARGLLGQGVRELVLIAQDLSDYGHDTPGEGNLAGLVRDLAGLDGLDWLRMLYLYPRGITDELLSAIRDVGRPILPYFDIPLQHSHPDVLKRMGRPFETDPERVCDHIREVLPDAALRTTLIVGYPGETEAQFRHLCDFVEKMRFTQLGVFPYWPEEGTVAASLPDQLPDEVKKARRDEIMSRQKDISHELLEGFVGSTMDVLVDSINPEWPGLHNGRAWFQAPEVDGITYVSGPGVFPGAMVPCDIDDSTDYDLSALSILPEEGAGIPTEE